VKPNEQSSTGISSMDKARIRDASRQLHKVPPEDLLQYVLEEKNTSDELKALLSGIAAAKYQARTRTQGVVSGSREDPFESFARKYKLNHDYMKTFLLIAQGLSDRDIAKELGSSVNTIHNRVKRILAKTKKNRRYELIALAYEYGFLPKPQT
jgi:DNA-binding NarL/FixJ family response regulator